MEELIRVLEKSVSSQQRDQNEAIAYVQQYIERDYSGFLRALSDVLYNQQNPPLVRTSAGLQLKNQLSARDEAIRSRQQERWRTLPDETRQYIKERVFQTLGTEMFRPSSASQCVAYIALIELPEGRWPGLIAALTENVTNPASQPPIRLASLESIGYICQDIDQSCIQAADLNNILTAIVGIGMRVEECDEVKLAATTALLNSLEFTEANFKKENERDYIMHAVCTTTQSPNPQIAVAALQSLVKIMSLYYQYMDRYMQQALFPITTTAMKSENDEIALQGIEFWSNVCDEEVQLAQEAEEARELGNTEQLERESKKYAQQALPTLVPILVDMLTRQDENDDTEDWKPCKSAGVCLMLLSNCCGNDIVTHVLPYIRQNVSSDDWRHRDAAVMTFGSILDGPDPQTLQPIAVQIVPFLINFMRDSSIVVRDSAAWAIGKLCDTVPEAVLSLPDFLDTLVVALEQNLNSEPRVSTNVCWAINSLVTAAEEVARERTSPNGHPETFILSKHYSSLIQGLLAVTEREDCSKEHEQNLRNAAYEALMRIIRATPNDSYQYIYPSTFEIFMRRISTINQTIQRPDVRAPEVRAQLYDFLSLLWTTLASCIRRMDKEHTKIVSDNVMQNMLITLNFTLDSSATQEDVLMASSALLESVGTHFSRYMEAFKPFLLNGLTNTAAPQLNSTSVGLLSDLADSLKLELLPYCNEFMNALLTKLKEDHYDKHAKAQILSVFGDFALAFGKKFEPWISACLDMLHHASQYTPTDRNDYDLVDYCIRLRECTVEGYTGIIHGMKERDGKSSSELGYLLSRIPTIIHFLEIVGQDPDCSDALICSSCGLIGDIVESFGGSVAHLVNSELIKELVVKGRRSRTEKTMRIANWTQNVIKKLLNAPRVK